MKNKAKNARIKSAAIMVSCLFHLSTNTPTNGPNSSTGSEEEAMTMLRSKAVPFQENTTNTPNPKNATSSPIFDTICPIHNFRKFRFFSTMPIPLRLTGGYDCFLILTLRKVLWYEQRFPAYERYARDAPRYET